jgi:hypothetical protein
MTSDSSSEDTRARLEKLAGGFKKLPRKLKLLLPFKSSIRTLLSKRATYAQIRSILAEVEIFVSTDTVHRFCNEVIGRKAILRYKLNSHKRSSPKVLPVLPSPEKIEAKLREQREHFPGPWSRRKRGPHIADSKNL